MADLSWSIIVAIIYFALYFLLVIGLAIHIYVQGTHTSKKSFLSTLWKKRGIYGQVFVHFYDTATDIGVMVEWYLLAEQERNAETPEDNIESLDMNGLFWATVAFLIAYRVISVCLGAFSTAVDDVDDESGTFWICINGCLFGLLDLYIIKTVYQSIQEEDTEPSPRQKMLQLTESIFESLPQVVLQSVFIIRSWNDEELKLKDDNSIELVAMSLVASLFSISTKYFWVDRDAFIDDARQVELSAKCPCVNPRYVLRVIWRFSYILTRFCILSLVWSVMGGAFCVIFLAVSLTLWSIIFVFEFTEGPTKWKEMEGVFEKIGFITVSIFYGCASLVASPAHSSIVVAISHGVEMLFTMGIITLFAFVDSIDCGICADPSHRSTDNPYVLGFIVTGWIAMFIDFLMYSIMLYCVDIFDDDDTASSALIRMFLKGAQNDNAADFN
eukprot:840953_1